MIAGGLSLDRVFPERLPESFRALAVPASMLPGGKWPDAFASVPDKIVTDPAEAQFCRMMPDEAFRVRLNFQRQLEATLRKLAEGPARLAVLAPDVERFAADAEFAAKTLDMLRGAWSVLPPGTMRLAVRLRLPNPLGAASAEAFFRLLQTVPGLRGVFELHPHEPAFAACRPEWLAPFKMLAPTMEIVYGRDLGNRITPKLLGTWADCFGDTAQDVPMLFRPGLADAAALTLEAEELAKTVAEWQKGGAV